VHGADAAVLVTRWREYEDELPATLGALERQPVLVDGRRVIDPESVGRYDGIGRPDVTHSRS
jgi:hypothetical protein